MIQARRENPVSDCPLTAALAALGGKWKLIIVYWLAESPRHFAAIRQCMPDISQKVLTEQLGELIADEIVDPEAELAFFRQFKLRDKALKTYPGFYHEPFNEVGKDTVFEDLRAWIASHK